MDSVRDWDKHKRWVDTIDINVFLAFMHDRLFPTYIRNIIDSIEVDIPLDLMSKMANEEFGKTNLISRNTNIHPPEELTPKDFVVSFTQTMFKFKHMVKSKKSIKSNVSKSILSNHSVSSNKMNMKG
jgi:hypothetical protein